MRRNEESTPDVKSARKEIDDGFLELRWFFDDIALKGAQRTFLDQWLIDQQIRIADFAGKLTVQEAQAGVALGKQLARQPDSPLTEAVLKVAHGNVTTATDHTLSGIVEMDFSDCDIDEAG